MHLFYYPNLSNEILQLDEEESKHAIRVLRLRAGDRVWMTDGRGKRCEAEVADEHPKRCLLRVLSSTQEQQRAAFQLHLAVAPTKSIDRMEWFVEKATEIGIDEISMIECGRSERTQVKAERLEKIAVSAMKQSMSSWLPQVHALTPFEKFLDQFGDFSGQRFIAHCHPSEKQLLKKICTPGADTLILIGPEGDFTEAEVAAASAKNFIPVSLGDSRLRTETAALVAVMSVNLLNA